MRRRPPAGQAGIRITGGTARGRVIESPKGYQTRPALARLRNSLFNIIQSIVPEARVLNLFAGTGSLGLESLSRGAQFCFFVENNRECFDLIRQNLNRLGFDKQAEVVLADGLKILPRLQAGPHKFDIVFVDPPYKFFDQANIRKQLLGLLDELVGKGLVDRQGRFVIEHRQGQLAELNLVHLELVDQREYGQTRLSFLAVRAGRTES